METPFSDRFINLVTVGHVDHGKSTLVGRLLCDTQSLPDGKLEQVQAQCKKENVAFQYSFLIDALKEEQSQGITLDCARIILKGHDKLFRIFDAPGQMEFIKNMLTGASRADVALLLVDVAEGLRENTKRHAFLLSFLKIKNVIVLFNKMDAVSYSQATFCKVRDELLAHMGRLQIEPRFFIPISAYEGHNVSDSSSLMPWYTGPTLWEALSRLDLQQNAEPPFRMFVQDIYPTPRGSEIFVGNITSGSFTEEETLLFYPSQKLGVVTRIEGGRQAPLATGFEVEPEILITRGELVFKEGEIAPRVTPQFKASLFWLGAQSLQVGKTYLLKAGTQSVPVRLRRVDRLLDPLETELQVTNRTEVPQYAAAECVLETEHPIVFDPIDVHPETCRFVLIEDTEIQGGGFFFD